MVVITDGGDTVSKTNYQDAVREAQQAEVILYSIIIVPIENSAGARHWWRARADSVVARYGRKVFLRQRPGATGRQRSGKSAMNLRTQYLIAYYPSARLSDSDYRRIEIKINPATKDYSDPSDSPCSSSHRLLHHACQVISRPGSGSAGDATFSIQLAQSRRAAILRECIYC